MKILVAGHGFIGERLTESLDGEHDITTLDLQNADINQDITEEFELDEYFDVVYHLVGLPPGFYSEPVYDSVHVEGTKNLLNAVDADKIVFLSALKAGEFDHSFFRTKKKAEDLVKDYDGDYTIIRPSTVYGEGNRLIHMIRQAAKTRVFPLIESQIQPIHVDDITEILARAVDEFDNCTLNIAGPEKIKVSEFARHIYAEEGYPCHLFYFPEKPLNIGFRLLDRLPKPIDYEQVELLSHQNTTEENDAADLLDLKVCF